MKQQTAPTILGPNGKPFEHVEKVVDSRALLGIDLPGSYIDSWHKTKKPDRMQLFGAYQGFISTLIDYNAQKVARTPLCVYRKSRQTVTKSLDWGTKALSFERKAWLESNNIQKIRVSDSERLEELTDHPLCKLLDRPNPYLTWFDFSRLVEIHKWVAGAAYIWIKTNGLKMPAELHLLYPAWIKTIYDAEKQVPEYYEYGRGKMVMRLELDEVVPLIIRDPKNYYEPYSPLAKAYQKLNLYYMFEATEAALLQNEGKPSVVLTPKEDGGIGEDEAIRAEQRFNTKFRRAGSGGALVLEGDFEMKPLNYSPREMGSLKIEDSVRLELLNAFHIPFALFSATPASQYNVQMCAVESWINDAIVPQICLNQHALNEYLVSRFDDSGDLMVAYENPSPQNREYLLDEVVKLTTASIMEVNEARAKFNLEPRTYGDKPAGMYGQALVPAEETTQEAPQEQEASDETTQEVQTLPENTLNGAQIASATAIVAQVAAGALPRDSGLGQLQVLLNLTQEQAEQVMGSVGAGFVPTAQAVEETPKPVEPIEPPQEQTKAVCCDHAKAIKGHNKQLPDGKALKDVLRKCFQKQRAAVLAQLTGKKSIKGLLPSKFALASKWDRELFTESQPVIEMYVKQGFEKEQKELVARTGISDEVFNVENPHLQEQVKKLALHFCEETNATTSEEINRAIADLRESMEEGLSDGERMAQLKDRVSAIFDSAEDFRAERIAQTESSRSHHEAQREAAKQSGVVKGFRLLPSSACCDICAGLADKEIGLDDSFTTDENAPAEYQDRLVPIHPNCECTMESVLSDDYQQGGE